MPKVCYISPISIHSVRYMEAFKQKGYDVSIIADSHTWVAPTPKSIPTYNLPQLTKANFLRRYISNTYAIARILRNIRPDLVHLHLQTHYSPAILLSRTPYILTSWGMEVLTLPNDSTLVQALGRTAAWKAHTITVDANVLKQIWTQMGIPQNKIQIIPFGVDLSIFNPNINRSAIRKKLEIEKDDVVLISTRALRNHHYNVESFIKAMPLILKSCSNAKFIVKGEGPLESYLKEMTRKLAVSDKVHFVGLVSHSEYAKYLGAADIYVSTSFVDTTSVSLLEAMACGLAPVVTNIEGNREWIANGKNGFLFQPRNYEDLATKAIQLTNDEQLRRKFGENCHEKAAQKASWTDCLARMEHIYNEILQKQK